jgi:hypothetical protein
MLMKTKIKIIKKSKHQEPGISVSPKPPAGREATRETVTAVKGWVVEFQIKKKEKGMAAQKESQLIPVPQNG